MRWGVTTKFFVVILLSNLLVLGALVWLMQWSFDRSLLGYVNKRERRQVEVLAQQLERRYAEQGNWAFVRRRPGAWRGLIIHLLAGRDRPGGAPRLAPPDELRRGPPPPGARAPLLRYWRFGGLGRRLALFDPTGQRIVGNPDLRRGDYRRVLRNDGRVIGALGIQARRHLTEAFDLEFRRGQTRALYGMALVLVVFAALIAVLLARHTFKPVRSIARGARALAAGDYGRRIPPGGADELGQLGRDFNTLSATLAANEQARRQWIADISHELRTPLSILRGEIEALQDGTRPLDAAAVASLHEEVWRLRRLVDDLYQLSLSDLGALQYRKELVQVDVVLREEATSLVAAFGEKQVSLDVRIDTGLALNADAGRLRQLFSNLLHNSLRYTDRGGRLRVRAAMEDGSIVIDMQDSTPAVAETELPRIFDRLYRVERSRSRDRGGAGLGLAICQRIVAAHQGSITAHPSPLGGLWIRIRFPQ